MAQREFYHQHRFLQQWSPLSNEQDKLLIPLRVGAGIICKPHASSLAPALPIPAAWKVDRQWLFWSHGHPSDGRRPSLRLGHFLISSSFQRLKDIWCKRVLSCDGIEFLGLSRDAFSSTWSSSFHFSDGREGRSITDGTPSPEKSRRRPSYARRMTDVVLDINTLVYVGQVATRWKLLSWGAKVNHLIDKGKWWRLATSNFLHVNIVHFLLNCMSLDIIGRGVEALAGPERFLTVYATSAIASQAMSYRLDKAFSVGASGPVCGLIGYLAVDVLRHGGPTGDANKDLNLIARIIIFNMVAGVSAKRPFIWGHVGGFLGGAATLWLLDPAGKLEYRSSDGRTITINIKGREKAPGSRK